MRGKLPFGNPRTQIYTADQTGMGEFRMPYYNFDLVIGEEFKNQGGLILEDLELASDRAEQLACELCIVRPELKARLCGSRHQRGEFRTLSHAA